MKSDSLNPPYTYDFPKADNTVDIVVFGFNLEHKTLNVLLIQRRDDPFQGHWAIPGGFVNMDETLAAAARRELNEETHVDPNYLEQLGTYGDPGRDPRGRVISTVYMALVRPEAMTVQADDDASDARWFRLESPKDADKGPEDAAISALRSLPPLLAFDHRRILVNAVLRLRSKLRWQPVGLDLLPQHFTLPELQTVYEVILGRTLDRRNFRKRVLQYKVLQECGRRGRAVLYKFLEAEFIRLQHNGVDFEVS